MSRTILFCLFAALAMSALIPQPAGAAVTIDLETGAAFAGYNDVRIPGTTGTEFSLTRDLESDPAAFFRARLSYKFGQRHTLSLLVAPLRLKADGRIDRDILFEDEHFPAGSDLRATYRFDSYRLTYRYRLYRSETVQFGLGLTAKIRDAAISVESDSLRAEKTNTGFVPLINFRLTWDFAPPVGLLLEGDALAAPQGRAEDVLLALHYRPIPRLAIKAGYRILEGGADVDEVYNFALVNYLVIGGSVSF
jgi:hypothetical protein